MTLTFDELSHTYRWDGEVVPSVTQILRPLDAATLDAIPSLTLKVAAQRGVAVHRACEFLDQGRLNERSIDPRIAGYVDAWRKFRREAEFVAAYSELRLYHPKWGYAGTIDSVGVIGRNCTPAIVDRKTSLAFYPSVGPQLAAYLALHPTVGPDWGDRVPRLRFSVRLMADGEYELKQFSDADDLTVFQSLLNVRNWRRIRGITDTEV